MTALWQRNRWWVRRVLALPLHLFLFAIVVFFLVRLIPGDPVTTLTAGQPVTPEQILQAREALGLDGSLLHQLLTYLGNLVTLNFGHSLITGTSVTADLAVRLPETIELAGIAIIGCVVVAFLASFLVLFRPRSPLAAVLTQYARTAGAVPDFVLGVVAIFVFYAVLHLAPAPLGLYDQLLTAPASVTGFPIVDAIIGGDTDVLASMAQHLVLPELVLIATHTPFLMKIFVRAVLDAADAPSTQFRIASGASPLMVLGSIARRASPSAIAMFGTMFGTLLGGAVVIEQLFNMPGLGSFGINAVNTADLVSLEAFLLLVAALSLTVFLIVDIVNMVVDPRRRPGIAQKA